MFFKRDWRHGSWELRRAHGLERQSVSPKRVLRWCEDSVALLSRFASAHILCTELIPGFFVPLLLEIVKVLQESENHEDIISAVTNEYVRDVCTHIPYAQCTETSFVSHKLLEQKSKLDNRIAHFLLVVESFIVEKITFDLDVQKHKHDETEYNHQRECQNKIMEAKVIEQETKNRKARAAIDQAIFLSEAKAQSEATAVASERQHQIDREHLRKMNELEAEHLRQKNELVCPFYTLLCETARIAPLVATTPA